MKLKAYYPVTHTQIKSFSAIFLVPAGLYR